MNWDILTNEECEDLELEFERRFYSGEWEGEDWESAEAQFDLEVEARYTR